MTHLWGCETALGPSHRYDDQEDGNCARRYDFQRQDGYDEDCFVSGVLCTLADSGMLIHRLYRVSHDQTMIIQDCECKPWIEIFIDTDTCVCLAW